MYYWFNMFHHKDNGKKGRAFLTLDLTIMQEKFMKNMQNNYSYLEQIIESLYH